MDKNIKNKKDVELEKTQQETDEVVEEAAKLSRVEKRAARKERKAAKEAQFKEDHPRIGKYLDIIKAVIIVGGSAAAGTGVGYAMGKAAAKNKADDSCDDTIVYEVDPEPDTVQDDHVYEDDAE